MTSLSYLSQVKKAWPRGSTDDLSWKMLSGLALWSNSGTATEGYF
jgi:MtN3 and saliva related transmembrane protein